MCWYDGKQLAANFATQIAQLAEATGREWVGEHTGGGCFWLVTYQGDAYVAITTTDGPFDGDDTPANVSTTGAGYTIGAYADPESGEGEYTDCDASDEALVAAVTAACTQAFATDNHADGTDDDDGERMCAGCGNSFNTEEGGEDFNADAGGPLCNRCSG